MKSRASLIIGGVLMVVLGLARGGGGLVLILRGAAADSLIRASESTTITLGAFLLFIGLGLVVAAVGVLRRRRWGWLGGIALTVAFVIDGAINGYVLFGRPGDGGTLMNSLAAVLILAFLFLGRSKLEGRAAHESG